MDRFGKYLKDSWAITQAIYAHKKAHPLNISIGNVSGDMDSVVGAIVLGYYLTYQSGFYGEEEKELDTESLDDERLQKFFVPMINMHQADLEARSDIIHHFEVCGVNKDHIPGTDNIDLVHYANEGKLGVNLVDHNLPDYTQEFLTPFVERVLDHHEDLNADYPNIKHKDVRFCGAAGTLVAKLILDDSEWCEKLMDKNVALFACSPILIDTVNFKEKLREKKWSQIDEDIYNRLKDIAGDHMPADYFKTLYHLKTDEETNLKLGWHLLARKDYKNYKYADDKILGISTVFLSLEACEREYGAEKMKEEFEKIMDERNLNMYMILTHYSQDNDVKRQVLTYSRDLDLAAQLKEFFDKVTTI